MEISSSTSSSGRTAISPYGPFIARGSRPEPQFASAIRGAQRQVDARPSDRALRGSKAADAPVGTMTRAMKHQTWRADETVDRACGEGPRSSSDAPVPRWHGPVPPAPEKAGAQEKSSPDESGRSSGREPTTARSHSESPDDVWATSNTASKARKAKWISRRREPSHATSPRIQPKPTSPRSAAAKIPKIAISEVAGLFDDQARAVPGCLPDVMKSLSTFDAEDWQQSGLSKQENLSLLNSFAKQSVVPTPQELREQRRRLALFARTDSQKLKGLLQDVRTLLATDVENRRTPALDQTGVVADTATIAGDYALEHTDEVVKTVDKWLTKHPSATDTQIFEQIMGALIGGTTRPMIRSVVADLPEKYCRTVALPRVALNEELGIRYDDSDLIDRSCWTAREKEKAAYKKATVAHIHGSIVGGALCPAIKRGLFTHARVADIVDTIETTMSGVTTDVIAANVDEKTRQKWHAAFETFATFVIARGTDLCNA